MDNGLTLIERRPILAERFEVISLLGEGSAGAVYHVRDRERARKEVALKILLNNAAFDEHTLVRFERELEICKKLQHPNIVEAYDLIKMRDMVAFTMEFVRGADLGRTCASRRLETAEIDSIFAQLLKALSALHMHGVVHRDLKLENMLIRHDGVLKLSDLGLVKQPEAVRLTRTGILLGTAQYMPPEYIKQSKYDNRGDLYAAGIALYEMLCGVRRLSDKSGMEAIEHLIKTKFEIPQAPLYGVSPRYRRVLEKALEVEPKKRYQSADEMLESFTSKDEGAAEATVLKPGLEMGRLRVPNYIVSKRRKRRVRLALKIILSVITLTVALAVAMKVIFPQTLQSIRQAPGLATETAPTLGD